MKHSPQNSTDIYDNRPPVRKPYIWIPLVIFIGLVAVLARGLYLDPKFVPSPLIGKTVPQFSLPPVKGRLLGLSSENLSGEVSIVNVFASWCVACRQEHPILMRLSKANEVTIHGLNYKDQPDDADQWLNALGDPYTRTGADRNGRVAIDWGVYGVPETFVIDQTGRIAYKHIGPITERIWQEKIGPLVMKLRDSDH